MNDFTLHLKAEFFDRVYLQQNAYDEIDRACSPERQEHVFGLMQDVLKYEFSFETKDQARDFFFKLQSMALSWNETLWQSDSFKEIEAKIRELI